MGKDFLFRFYIKMEDKLSVDVIEHSEAVGVTNFWISWNLSMHLGQYECNFHQNIPRAECDRVTSLRVCP